jgi:hypothetical protein
VSEDGSTDTLLSTSVESCAELAAGGASLWRDRDLARHRLRRLFAFVHLILAAIGGAIGGTATSLILDGFTSSTLASPGWVFSFQLGPHLVGQNVGLRKTYVGGIGATVSGLQSKKLFYHYLDLWLHWCAAPM